MYDNLGTPEYFWELFNQLQKWDLWTEEDIWSYFFNKIIDNNNIFDGCLPLLKLSNIIYIDEESKEIKRSFNYRNILHSKQLCRQKLLEWFLISFHKDDDFYNIFSSENSSYDLIYKTIQIDYSAFWLKYSNIRKLLLDFDFLIKHPNFPYKKLIINPSWKKFFDKNFAPEIRKRKIWIEELKKNLEEQQINWEEAEKFVLDFEYSRLGSKEWVEWIAPYDSAAWYDILSYHKKQSINNDRFIEVKSYAWETPYFYWTQNEIKTAQKKADNYFLYLVNREEISNENYTPNMIMNPIVNILDNEDWIKNVDRYYIVEKN